MPIYNCGSIQKKPIALPGKNRHVFKAGVAFELRLERFNKNVPGEKLGKDVRG